MVGTEVGIETDIERGWLATEEVAERLAVPVEVVRLWMRNGKSTPAGDVVKLKCIWIGPYRAIREEWLATFIAKTAPAEE